MAKNFNVTDPTPLYDGKILFFRVDGVAGITQSGITRTYDGTPDTRMPFKRYDGTELTASDFKDGDVILVEWDSTAPAYYLVELKAHLAKMSDTVTNGFSQAGYIVDNNGDIGDNTEDFEIPTGLRVGFGGNGATERILCKGGLETGQAGSKLKVFQIPTSFPWSGGSTVVGDTLNDTNHGGFFGFGSELGPYFKSGEGGLGDVEYTSESGVTDSLISFDGEYTLLGGTSQSELDVGDIRLIDLIDDDLVSNVGRYRAELVTNPVGGNWNWKVKGNITDLIVSTNYTAGVIPNFNNSFSIGNNAYPTAQNQIVLGSSGVAGTIKTDYTIATGTGTSYFDVIDANNIILNDGAASITIDVDGGSGTAIHITDDAGIVLDDGNISSGSVSTGTLNVSNVTNTAIGNVPLKVTGIAGTTADLWQIYDDIVKAVWVDNTGTLNALGNTVLGEVGNGGDLPWLDMGDSGAVTIIGWGNDPIANFADAEFYMSPNTLVNLRKTVIVNSSIGEVPLNVKGMTGTTADLFQVYDDTLKSLWVDSSGTTNAKTTIIDGNCNIKFDGADKLVVTDDDVTVSNAPFVLDTGVTLTCASQVNFSGLPTSSGGLSAGDLWNDSGTLKIV